MSDIMHFSFLQLYKSFYVIFMIIFFRHREVVLFSSVQLRIRTQNLHFLGFFIGSLCLFVPSLYFPSCLRRKTPFLFISEKHWPSGMNFDEDRNGFTSIYASCSFLVGIMRWLSIKNSKISSQYQLKSQFTMESNENKLF